MRRPDVFTLDYSHPLAQGLVFFPAFNTGAGRPVDLITRTVASNFLGAWGFDSVVSAAANGLSDYPIAPITDPTGDFTFHAVTNQGSQYSPSALVGLAVDNTALLPQRQSFSGIKLNAAHNSDGQTGASWCVTVGGVEGATKSSALGAIQTIGTRRAYTGIRKNGVYSIYADGVLLSPNISTHGSRAVAMSSVKGCVGGLPVVTGNTPWTLSLGVGVWDAAIYNRALSPAEIALLADRTDPMLGGLVREVSPVAYFDFGASAPTDITGTMSATESGTDSIAATGQLLVSGIMSVTETGSDTIAVSGKVLIQGTLSATETGSDVFAAYGGSISPITGTMAVTESDHDTATIIGQLLISGLMDVSEVGDDVFAAIGSALPTITGDMAVTESGADAFAASGTVTDTAPITAAEVARTVIATARMKTVTASPRVKQVRYEITRA